MSDQPGQDREDNQETGNQQQNENRFDNSGRRGGRSGNRHRGQGRSGSLQPPQTNKNSLNLNELRELADLIDQHGFTGFEFENENIRVRLRKDFRPPFMQAAPTQSQITPNTAQQAASPQIASQPISVPETSAVSNASALVAAQPKAADGDANLKKIVSPIVGTFYHAPSPEAEPFVKIGSQVSAETIVCIVEAMKLMNEIPAELSGEIVKMYVENGQPVEYGQPLFAVK